MEGGYPFTMAWAWVSGYGPEVVSQAHKGYRYRLRAWAQECYLLRYRPKWHQIAKHAQNLPHGRRGDQVDQGAVSVTVRT